MRTKNALRNILAGVSGKFITLLLGIVSRVLFLKVLDVKYLGASGLFSSILSVLSFAELGIGTAIVYSLYKPLAEKNEAEILALMNVYKKVYRIIGLIILVAGCSLTPFIRHFISGDPGIEHLQFIYILFVINTASTYFFSYNRTLITADQKAYKLFTIDLVFKVFDVAAMIAVLFAFRSYPVYLAIQIVLVIKTNVIIFLKVRQEYPILKSKAKTKLDEPVRKTLVKNVTALVIYKMAIVSLNATDNILISLYMGLTQVGILTNYTLIITNAIGILSQITSAVTASIGNLNATENSEKKYRIFLVTQMSNFWIYGFSSICLLVLFNPFIKLFFGGQYLFDWITVLALVLGFYTLGMQHTVSTFRDAAGLFWQGKLRPLAQAIVNIVASIVLYKLTNHISAIFFGTVISRITTLFWFDPYIVHKYTFNRPVKKYFVRYVCYTAIAVLAGTMCVGLGELLMGLFQGAAQALLLELILKAVVCILVSAVLFYLFLHKTEEYQYLVQAVKRVLSKKKPEDCA